MMTGLPQSVLRYWETVFDNLNPNKSSGGNRQYSESNVDLIKKIKELLYDQGYTIKGAINKFKHKEEAFDKPERVIKRTKATSIADKQQIIEEIKEIIEILES
jgi:DNA-binding transcriptional MerR regulator